MVTASEMMPKASEVEQAGALMIRFAERTGLASDLPKERYLWTDAFAVCNFLGLAEATGKERYLNLALQLVNQVHHVLGRFRDDDLRSGWISGLSDQQGQAHPTLGGLRIGKPLAERAASERLDQNLEWQRDGQYFHYLTKWMHALDQVYRWTGQSRFNVWARELAKAAHGGFVYSDRSALRMAWKMSTDLSRPLVPSMGHHDPLDGFITCTQLQTTKSASSSDPRLSEEVADFGTMIAGQDWATTDPLGLGGLLADAARVAQLMNLGAFSGTDLLKALLAAALRGLGGYARYNELIDPASQRLAFRELGLAIGLCAVALIENELGHRGDSQSAEMREQIHELRPYVALGSEIKSFWLDPAHQQSRTWSEHRNINEVMLATSLIPGGFLKIR